MEQSIINFNIDIREWVSLKSHVIHPSGSDDKLIIQYVDDKYSQHSDITKAEQIEILEITEQLAVKCDVECNIEFSDIGHGRLIATIIARSPFSRKEACEAYYNILILGPNMTAAEHRKMIRLKKKFGFN